MQIGEFTQAVFNSWVDKVGVVLSLLPFIEKIPWVKKLLKDRPLLEAFETLLWLSGIAILLVSFYSAWGAQRELVEQVRNEAKQYKQDLEKLTVPRLKLSIDEIGIGDLRLGNSHASKPGVFVTANLTNDGAPSIAEGWSLKTTLNDGKSEQVGAMYVDPNQTVAGRGSPVDKDWKMSLSDSLYNKASKPIQAGDKIRGILIFEFPQLVSDDMKRKGTTFVLSCVDVKGNPVTTSYVFRGYPETHSYFPGLSPIPK
jgi:hypothetical protein